jgi:2-deoxy-D-gluconate 3-dehydrogenase
MQDAFNLTGKAALVTGAGRGLGRSMAMALANAGAAVVLVARREDDLQSVAAEIRAKGGRAAHLALEVGGDEAGEKAVQKTVDEFGRIDILVNNAGVSGMGPSLDYSIAQWKEVLQVNLTAPFVFAQAAGKRMAAQKSGKIINIASMYGMKGEPQLAAYCTSKGGLIQLTRTLAIEWARYNIQVNAVAPGYFETDMVGPSMENPKVVEGMLKKIPARRFGKPDELGPLVVYMASAASNFMTGEVVVIDGGESAR